MKNYENNLSFDDVKNTGKIKPVKYRNEEDYVIAWWSDKVSPKTKLKRFLKSPISYLFYLTKEGKKTLKRTRLMTKQARSFCHLYSEIKGDAEASRIWKNIEKTTDIEY